HSIETLTMQQTIWLAWPAMVQHGMKFGATPPGLAKPAPAKTALTPASAVVRPRRRIANLLMLNPNVSPSTLISLLPKLRLRPGRSHCGRYGHLQDGVERSAAVGDAAERRSARAHGIEQ